MLPPIPDSWLPLLREELAQDYFRALATFLESEMQTGQTVLPARADIFNALKFTSYENVKVLLLGQDPYPNSGDAHGLCFSVRPGVKVPRSLQNVYKELRADVGFRIPNHGTLEAWAWQGMLMLNTVLTLRSGEAFSHRGRGWEKFTDRIIAQVNAKPTRVVFVLWGKAAQAKRSLITAPHHRVVECGHPSPLSARFFMGCRCFSKIDAHLAEAGLAPISWQLADVSFTGIVGGASQGSSKAPAGEFLGEINP